MAEDGTGGTASPTAALDALKGDAAFMERVDKRDAAAQREFDAAYMRAFPEPAGDDAGGVRVERTGDGAPETHEGYALPAELEGKADAGLAEAFKRAALAEAMDRRTFHEIGERYYSLASETEAPATPEGCEAALTRWHGDDAPKILAAARAAAQRTIAANPVLEEVFAALGNDATSVTLLGLHELARGRR